MSGPRGSFEGPTTPVVSVCIPLFNPQRCFLEPLFTSIQRQGVPVEVVLVDDASDLDQRPIVEELAGCLRPVVDRNPANLGMVGNWNEVVRRSSADLVMVVCQDDVLGDGMLARYVEEFAGDPDVVICGGAEVFIDADGEFIEREDAVTQRSHIFRHQQRYHLSGDDLTRLCLRNGQAFGEPSAVMFRRDAFDRAGGYSDRYEHASDVDFNIRVARKGVAAYVNRPYLRRRIHAHNLTWNHIASGAASRDRVQLHEDYGPRVDATSRHRARVTLVAFALNDVRRALRTHRWGVARVNLKTAVRYSLTAPRYYLEHLRELRTHVNLDER